MIIKSQTRVIVAVFEKDSSIAVIPDILALTGLLDPFFLWSTNPLITASCCSFGSVFLVVLAQDRQAI